MPISKITYDPDQMTGKSVASRADGIEGNKVLPTTEVPSPVSPGTPWGAEPDPFDGMVPGAPPPVEAPPSEPPSAGDSDVTQLPPDLIGDIPPAPVPARPARLTGPGVAGLAGSEAGTFARPGSAGAKPFRTPAYAAARAPRVGAGTPVVGGGPRVEPGVGGMLPPDEAAELLRTLALRGGA